MNKNTLVCSSHNERYLLIFSDFIQRTHQLHLDITVREDPSTKEPLYELWLAKQDERCRAIIQEAFEAYMQNPNDDRYIAASWDLGRQRTVVNQNSSNQLWQDIKQQAQIFTSFVILLCVTIFILQNIFPATVFDTLHYPADSAQYLQVWRFFSHTVMHFSFLHIVINLMWFWYLGNQVERQLGVGNLVTLFIISALLSGFAQFKMSGIGFGGLSGVVYALTSYCWLFGVRKPESGISLPTPILLFSIAWLVVGNMPFLGLSIANTAHLAGLVVGFAMAAADLMKSK